MATAKAAGATGQAPDQDVVLGIGWPPVEMVLSPDNTFTGAAGSWVWEPEILDSEEEGMQGWTDEGEPSTDDPARCHRTLPLTNGYSAVSFGDFPLSYGLQDWLRLNVGSCVVVWDVPSRKAVAEIRAPSWPQGLVQRFFELPHNRIAVLWRESCITVHALPPPVGDGPVKVAVLPALCQIDVDPVTEAFAFPLEAAALSGGVLRMWGTGSTKSVVQDKGSSPSGDDNSSRLHAETPDGGDPMKCLSVGANRWLLRHYGAPLTIQDIQSGTVVATVQSTGGPRSTWPDWTHVDPSGKWVAIDSGPMRVSVVSTLTGKSVCSVAAYLTHTVAVPGDRLVTYHRDGRLTVHSALNGELLASQPVAPAHGWGPVNMLSPPPPNWRLIRDSWLGARWEAVLFRAHARGGGAAQKLGSA